MELEPGPFWQRDEMPFGPRVLTDGLFAQLLEPLVSVLRGSDTPLGAARDQVGRDVPTDLELVYLTTVGAAERELEAQEGAGDDQTAPALVDAGEGSEVYRQSVLGYLPQPDIPIEVDFTDPPEPPPPGSGGDGSDDDATKD